MTESWWGDINNISTLLRYLDEQSRIDLDLVLEVLEKPWKWSAEWELAQEWVKTDA